MRSLVFAESFHQNPLIFSKSFLSASRRMVSTSRQDVTPKKTSTEQHAEHKSNATFTAWKPCQTYCPSHITRSFVFADSFHQNPFIFSDSPNTAPSSGFPHHSKMRRLKNNNEATCKTPVKRNIYGIETITLLVLQTSRVPWRLLIRFTRILPFSQNHQTQRVPLRFAKRHDFSMVRLSSDFSLKPTRRNDFHHSLYKMTRLLTSPGWTFEAQITLGCSRHALHLQSTSKHFLALLLQWACSTCTASAVIPHPTAAWGSERKKYLRATLRWAGWAQKLTSASFCTTDKEAAAWSV